MRTIRRLLPVALALAASTPLTGCDQGRNPIRMDLGGLSDLAMIGPLGDAASTSDLSEPILVYAHTATTLYSVDPVSLAVQAIGAFVGTSSDMYDIAVDKNGKMIGITSGTIYTIDPTNAHCTELAPFMGNTFNALSFISSDQLPGPDEVLVGANENADMYRVDPATGAQTKIGNYGGRWYSSGDLVSVEGATYATAYGLGDTADTLLKVDPTTAQGTPVGAIGGTGFLGIYGLGYWRQQLFGFTTDNDFVLINVTTGAATKVKTGSASWNGAGVTTIAPITVL
jgi:hypothetical protein